ncbi:hypothetical protein Zmor_013547 [Zophobas morio]|uniref:No apical meristem-associated C-terminal domain-containing protein n=1 Tax=Zophobas morio TaxID=2755281 RepID=A0AA38MFS7_9CUCU|nr:hypothetical protein Zmor_013547 [Zophobas morio]
MVVVAFLSLTVTYEAGISAASNFWWCKIPSVTSLSTENRFFFGAFSPSLIKETKQEQWKNIYTTALSLQLVPAGKDWTYVRDTTWPNLRKRALEKKDKIKKTGTGGGKESRLTEVDNKVLDILGKDSASVCGIGINDPIENKEEETNENLETENAIPSCSKHNAENCAEIETTQNIAALHKKKSKVINTDDHQEDEIKLLKKRKLELEIEYLEKINEKMSLEILKLKNELGIVYEDGGCGQTRSPFEIYIELNSETGGGRNMGLVPVVPTCSPTLKPILR